MIIYEVKIIEKVWAYGGGTSQSFYFSNKVKAKSFLSKNKNHVEKGEIIKHDVSSSKTGFLQFLNRDGVGA